MQIKFSHSYPKLHDQKSALLVAVELRGRSDFSEKFIEYDTAFNGGHYPLPPAQYMVLVFLGNELIPFTTVRRWTEEKFRYYHSAIGQTFEIVRVAAAVAEESAPTFTNTGMAAEAAQINRTLKSMDIDTRIEFVSMIFDGICPSCKEVVSGICYCMRDD